MLMGVTPEQQIRSKVWAFGVCGTSYMLKETKTVQAGGEVFGERQIGFVHMDIEIAH